MNTRYIKSILTLLLALTVLSIAANDYLKIYFKDGHTERHFMKLVENITVTKYDLEGNLHSDYQMQQIVMADTTYSYYLADIDSMAFRKYYEEQVRNRVESFISTMETMLEQNTTMEDLVSHMEEIKNIDGVEAVYYDGDNMFIQIRDWLDIYISSLPVPDNNGPSLQALNRRNIKRYNPTNEDGSPITVNISFQMIGDPKFAEIKKVVDKVNDEFSCMGYKTTYLLGGEMDFDYFYKRIFDSNLLLIDTHGGYGIFNKKHYLYTGIVSSSNDFIGSNIDWLFNISDDIDLDDIGISVCSYKGDSWFTNPFGHRWYYIVREDFIRKSPYRFTGAGPHIVFMAACSSLQGNDLLTRSDGVQVKGNDSFAQIFFDKGADVYLGYNKGTSRASFAAPYYYDYMLHGLSAEQAFKNLPDTIKYEEDKEEKGFLVDLYNKNSDNSKGIFIISTQTVEKTEQELLSEYQKNGQLELKGITAKLTPLYGVDEYGFRIGTEPDVDKSANYETISSNNAYFTGTQFGEIAFSAMFTPEDGKTYYYRAFTNDGLHYNWGEEKCFTVSHPSGSCPDDNHPHMIDLGLPSGTKWACCNVGASKPEDYGDYFAWGETQPKEVYDYNTYAYGRAWDDVDYIGSDIAGTEYDTANTNWGALWQMPTQSQCQELKEECSSVWTTQNGMNGRLFTGPNGNTIFLPAPGIRWNDILTGESSYGHYWSSTLGESAYYEPYSAFVLNFNSDQVDLYDDNRSFGRSVRPVKSSGTPSPSINVTTLAATDVSGTSATLNGSITASNTNKSYEAGFFLSTTSNSPSSTDNTMNVTCSSSSPVGDFSASATGLSAGTKYNYRAYVLYDGMYYYGDTNSFTTSSSASNTSCPDGNHPHMIDLGLPSGTKWACCNVGASKPEDYGDYFAWGETQPKEVYSWESYKFGYYNYDEDYSHLVNIGSDISGTQYDAATANWGAPWQMPSKEQYDELNGNCTSVWTTENGVNGRKFTGPNGISLFLPAAGFRWDYKLEGAGSYGNYWTSLLPESCPDSSWHLYFYSRTVSTNTVSYRRTGLSVRPVRK